MSDRTHPSAAPPKKTNLLLANLPPKASLDTFAATAADSSVSIIPF